MPIFFGPIGSMAVYAAEPTHRIAPLAPTPTPTAGAVPQLNLAPPRASQTPRPAATLTPPPTPTPTSDPMLQTTIREAVDKASITDIKPTPARATKDASLSVGEAVDKAIEAAAPSFRTLDIAEENAMKQVASIRGAVNMAIRALNNDDRYQQLADADDIWGGEKDKDGNYILNPDGTLKGDMLDPVVRAELSIYQAMGYDGLSKDDRLALEVTKDLGYAMFNVNILAIEHSREIAKNSIKYGVYAQYAGIAQMQAALELQKTAFEITGKTLEITQRRLELGYASKVELDSTQAAYNKAALEIVRSERSLKSLTASFNNMLGENLDTTYKSFDTNELAPTDMREGINHYIEKAQSERSEIILAAERKRLAEAEAEYYMAVYTSDRTFERYEKIQAADEAGIEYDLALVSVESDVRSAYKQLLALNGSLPYNERQIEIAKDSLARVQKMYELGTVTLNTVDSAAVAVSQAELQLVNNMINIWLQQKRLEIICGIGPGNLR